MMSHEGQATVGSAEATGQGARSAGFSGTYPVVWIPQAFTQVAYTPQPSPQAPSADLPAWGGQQ